MRSSPQAHPRPRGPSSAGPYPVDHAASFVTTAFLAVILVAASAILGAARLWYELPLLGVVNLMLFFQGVRLLRPSSGPAARRIDAIDLAVVVFVAYAIARWLTSPIEYFSRLEILNVVAYAGIFFTCRYGLERRTHALFLLGLLVVLGVFEVGFGYYLSRHLDWCPFGATERLHQYYAPRWVGTYGCPNHYSSLLAMATGAAFALGCFSKYSWPLRIVFFYAGALLVVGIIFSGSRGGWLALFGVVVALVIFALRHGTLRWWVPLTSAVVLVAFFLGLFSLSPFVQSRYAEVVDTVQGGRLGSYVRIELARDALHIARDHPVFGTGPGTFVFVHPRYQSSTFARKAVLTHDDYLNCLDDYGLVGLAIALFFVAAVTIRFFRQVRADHRWQDRAVIAAGFAAWVALAVHSFVDFNLHIPANACWLFALTGLGLRRTPEVQVMTPERTLPLQALGRWLGAAVVLFLLADTLVLVPTALSDIVYENASARALQVSTAESIQGAESALRIDPRNAQAWVFLGDLHRYRASRESGIENRVIEGQAALTAYQRALAANPLDDTIEGRLGMTFDIMRRYPEAFFCYVKAVTAQPYDGQFWKALGNHFWERGLLVKAEQAYLIAAQCPHGFEGSSEAAQEIGQLLDARGIPQPAAGTNPLAPEPEEPATTP
jgi:O-antigen ligase